MPRPKTQKREQILRAAENLTHRDGFRAATLAKLSREARIPIGNLYYYFKTKEEIADAIVADRAAEHRRALEAMEKASEDPRERLLAYVAMVADTRASIAANGCVLGSLCTELNKQGGPVARSAAGLLAEPLAWMEKQFRALGKGRESAELALHLLSAIQGIAVLANTFDAPNLVVTETKRLERWIGEL